MSRFGFPPTHRDPEDPQPEFCDVCGLLVGGAHLMRSPVEGLRSYMVCNITPGCRKFRAAMSYHDRRQLNAREHSMIGDARVFEAGGSDWTDVT